MRDTNSDNILTDLYYCPPVSWFMLIRQAKALQFDVYRHYQKGGWLNRCYILGPNGMQLLSVPLEKGKNERRAFRDVRISYEHPWQHIHKRTLESCYRRSAYFEYFEDDLQPIFESKPTYLLDWNIRWLEFCLRALKFHPEITYTEKYVPPGTSQITDLRTTSTDDPRHEEIASKFPDYHQVFSDRFPFQRNLSIIDYLFNQGNKPL